MNEVILSTDLQNSINTQSHTEPRHTKPHEWQSERGLLTGEQGSLWAAGASTVCHHSASPGICICVLSKAWDIDSKNKEKPEG